MTKEKIQRDIKELRLFQKKLRTFIACLNANGYAPKAAMLGVQMDKELQILINRLEQ